MVEQRFPPRFVSLGSGFLDECAGGLTRAAQVLEHVVVGPAASVPAQPPSPRGHVLDRVRMLVGEPYSVANVVEPTIGPVGGSEQHLCRVAADAAGDPRELVVGEGWPAALPVHFSERRENLRRGEPAAAKRAGYARQLGVAPAGRDELADGRCRAVPPSLGVLDEPGRAVGEPALEAAPPRVRPTALMDARRDDHIAAVAAYVQAGSEPTGRVADLAAGMAEVDVLSPTTAQHLRSGRKLSMPPLELDERPRATFARVDIQDDETGLRACADADVRRRPAAPPLGNDLRIGGRVGKASSVAGRLALEGQHRKPSGRIRKCRCESSGRLDVSWP
jgi:hypothetical protein